MVIRPSRSHLAQNITRRSGRIARDRIVITDDRHRAIVHHRHDSVDDFTGVRAIAYVITDERELRCAARACVCHASVKRLNVRVDIGKHRKFHSKPPIFVSL
jgi:hypothetical protein